MANVIDTIIFSPSDKPFDPVRTRQRLAHITRRGYRMVAFVREWPIVEYLLASKAAQVVLFASGGVLPAADQGAIAGEKTLWITGTARRRALSPPAPAADDRMVVPLGDTEVLTMPAAQLLATREAGELQADEQNLALAAAYREGYSDGFVDCLTIGYSRP